MLNTIALFAIIYCLYWNLSSFDRWADEEDKDNIEIPQSAFWIGPTFQINQYWGLFSPKPMIDDGWYVLSAATESGEKFDLFTNNELTWDKPDNITKMYKNDRWRKYLMNLWLGQHSDHRLHYGRYLCREYNSKNFGTDRVQSFWMYYMIEESPAPGEEQKGIYPSKIHEHICYYPEEENKS